MSDHMDDLLDNIGNLSSDELEELARYNETMAEVWRRMAANSPERKDYLEWAEHNIERAEHFRTAAVVEAATQALYEGSSEEDKKNW